MAIRPYSQRTTIPEYAGLPVFAVENVTIANARIDKFEIVFPRHQIEYSNVERFREYLREVALEDSLFSLYNPSPNVSRATRAEGLQFRAGRVFGGKRIYFKPIYGSNRRRFTIKLQCNFSRFAANNDIETMEQLPPMDWDDYEEDGFPRLSFTNTPYTSHRILEVNKARLNNYKRQSLDGNDNWMQSRIWQATQNIEQYFESYVLSCIDYIENEFFFPLTPLDIPSYIRRDVGISYEWLPNPALLEELGIMPIFDWSGFVINRAEIYHEFQHDNAIDFMRYIAPRIREIAPIINEAEHPYIREGRTYNAPSITVQLTRGIYLCVYAKTMNRTRWEIRFKKSIRDTLNDITTTEPSFLGLQSLEGIGNQECHIRDLMRVAIRYATEALQRFIGQLRLSQAEIISTSVIASFIHEIARACDNNPAIINLILSPLLRDGHITESAIIRAAIKELCRPERNVLARATINRRESANTRGYHISSRYAGVLAALTTVTA